MKSNSLFHLILLSILFSACQDISQWRGPERSGIYPDKGLLKAWPETGPELLLKIEGIGKGLSQAIVHKNKIYITGINSDNADMLSVYDMNGNLIWRKNYGNAWNKTYPESRCTPTIEKDKIFLIGGLGDLVCLNLKDGKTIWRRKPLDDFKGKYKHFGIAESVLLTDKAALFITAGDETTLVAYEKKNGDLLWKTKSLGGEKSYASSSLIEWKGRKVALVQTTKDLIGVDVSNGAILWHHNTLQYHTKKGKGEAANTPIDKDGKIFITYGNDHPGMQFQISEDCDTIKLKWENDVLDTHHGGLVLLDGVIYGSTMIHNTAGNWAAVDWETGETLWEEEWHTKGSIISADNMLYLYEEKRGNLALVQPHRETLNLISDFRITEGKGPHWAHPSIYDGKLFVRHGEILLLYNLKP